jgi:hypothetical protein
LYESLERIQTLDIGNHPEQGAFDSLIERFREHMEFFTAPAMEENEEKIKDAELDRKAVHEKEKLTQVFKAFQNIDGFLGSKDKHRSSFFRYCDIFVEYLYASERYGSLGRKVIQEFLNEQDHWIVLFHYIIGKFPNTDNITQLFLSYDLRSSLEGSPFTEEIHVLLGCESFCPRSYCSFCPLSYCQYYLITPRLLNAAKNTKNRLITNFLWAWTLEFWQQ